MTDRWKRLVPPVAGVLLVVGVTLSIVLLNTPSAGDSGAKVLRYYTSHHGRANAGTFLLGYSAVMAVVFYAGMASYMRRHGSDLLATLTVAGGSILAVGLALGSGATAAVNDHPGKLTASAAQALNSISEDIFFVALFAGMVVATLAMGISFLRTKSMPKALAIVTVIVGAGAATGIGAWFAFMATGPLTLVLAGYLYQRSGEQDSVTLPDVPGQRASEPAVEQSKAKA